MHFLGLLIVSFVIAFSHRSIASPVPQDALLHQRSSRLIPSVFDILHISTEGKNTQNSILKRTTKDKSSKSKNTCLSGGAVAGGTIGGFVLGLVLGGTIACFFGMSRGRKKGIIEGEKHASAAVKPLPQRSDRSLSWDSGSTHGRVELPCEGAETRSGNREMTTRRYRKSVPLPNMAELGPASRAPATKEDSRELVENDRGTVVHLL